MTSRVAIALAVGAAITALVLSEGGAMMVAPPGQGAGRRARGAADRQQDAAPAAGGGVVAARLPAHRPAGLPRTLRRQPARCRGRGAARPSRWPSATRGRRRRCWNWPSWRRASCRRPTKCCASSRAATASGAVELMLTDIGREQMVRIDEIVGEVWHEESLTFERTGRAQDSVLLWSRVGIAAHGAAGAVGGLRWRPAWVARPSATARATWRCWPPSATSSRPRWRAARPS